MNKIEKNAKETLIKEDLRVFKTIALIKSTFYELLNQYDFSEITVKMICEAAPINRSTFYRYYDSLDDLLNEFQQDTMNRYVERIKPFIAESDIYSIIKDFFYFAESEGEVFEKLAFTFTNDKLDMISGDEFIIKNLSDSLDNDMNRKFVLPFISSAILNMYLRWVRSGKQLPIYDIAELTSNLLINGLSAQFKKMDSVFSR